MRPLFSLRTRLVLAISGLVTAVVIAFASVYISQLVRQGLNDAYETGDLVAHQIFDATRQALEVDMSSTRVNTQDPEAMRAAAEETLQTDPGLNSLLQSIVGYSRPIYDAAIADSQGRALLHTDPKVPLKRQVLPARASFGQAIQGGLRRQFEIVFGTPQVYEIRIPIERNGAPFGSVRVGVSTVFLQSDLAPQLKRALILSGMAIGLTIILAGMLSRLALRPLTIIGRRLDMMAAGTQSEADADRESREVGSVTTKLNRIGREMRDVKEVFSTLKENLDHILANLQDGLVLFTRDERAVLVSAAVEGFLGIAREKMLGHKAAEFLDPQTSIGKAILGAFAEHRTFASRVLELEDGRRVDISLDFIEEGSDRMGALLTLRDAESIRRIEDEIELSHRLAAIGRLASGVGHEVKNPINAIVLHLEVLRQKLQQIDPDTRRHVDVIGSEIQRLDRVVQMLVDFTRPVEPRLANADLAKLVDEVVTLASPEAERAGVRIERTLAREPLPVRVDADLIKQSLLNVVMNAAQAMPQGGPLEIRLRRNLPEREAVVEIRDHGEGIPDEIRNRVFQLYFTTKQSGTGIGLAMTYKVMQLHHGAVSFARAEGGGTVFTLTLPLADRVSEPSRELAGKAAV